ncbi:hypothetical protein GDO81_002916 [Engystomops pustulosus]|uniref:Uncharacterized protein n=1 Tax=Engystomops pustulosus TaxID=76066 RepID=A0AAV7DQD7_ENGPU|nr:hypothetical protein GDO81_002916 [Engystomops pustulosus]
MKQRAHTVDFFFFLRSHFSFQPLCKPYFKDLLPKVCKMSIQTQCVDTFPDVLPFFRWNSFVSEELGAEKKFLWFRLSST